MKELINYIVANIDTLLATITAVVTAASAVAALTPTPKDDAILGKVYKIVDWFALNIGKAKEK